MDATAASGGNGFDAALRALEDLETSVAQVREDGRDDKGPAAVTATVPPAEPVLPPTSVLAFSDGDPADEPVAIAAVPLAEADPAPAPAHQAEPTEPQAAAPAPVPATAPAVEAPAARSGLWTKVAIGLGLASSAVSAAGLVIAERTIMSARLVVADARERQAQLAQANRLIQDLQLVRDRQVELLKAQQAQLASAPVSSAELQHRMEVLQEGIMKRDPVNQVIEAIRAGQSDNNARVNELGTKIDRLEAALRH
ncbi:hypothetical protein [Rhizorhabdus dicambivorans]|uniref:Uncharacterized protein n=1 Tax=Rhizorhabdus dicambivorans TaxID=1850238 RepID=A0A2A4FU37_9SPHN|nr:hypothetical protein [Rhizorhabdus dicambivorans]ATE64436.1 hypothetical protein CMV14_08525 [Rhizorhabdus dicambivorans]PCE41214.1 hypothetical protein COO09_16185 [Rhizorhabdus dicambivorans]